MSRKAPDVSTQTKRVAVYARRSSVDSDKDRSITEQVAECRRWAATLGFEVVKVYEELGSGVTATDRPHFMRMVAEAEGSPRPFDAIVCLDVSRFGRTDIDEAGYWRHRLRLAGVEARFVHDDARLSGEAGPIMGAVLQHSAREHSIKTALRVTMGQVAAAERGCWPGGIAPFGYRLVRREGWNGIGRRDSRLIVDEREAKIVREAFELYAKGKGTSAVAGALNAKLYRTRKGKLFSTSVLQKLLANPVYRGDIERCRTRRVRNSGPGSKFFRGSSHGPVPIASATDGYAKPGAVPAIVSQEVWNKVEEVARSRFFKRTGGKPGLFAGLVRCGVCQGPLVQTNGRTVNGRRYAYLGCRSCRDKGLADSFGECGRVSVPYHTLLDRVVEILREETRKIDPEAIAEELRRRLAVTDATPNVADLEARRRRLGARRRELVLAESDFERSALAELAAEDRRLAQQIDSAKRAAGSRLNIEERVNGVVEAARALEIPLAGGEEALRAPLRAFVQKIVVGPADRREPRPVEVTHYTTKGAAFLGSDGSLTRPGGSGSTSYVPRCKSRSRGSCQGAPIRACVREAKASPALSRSGVIVAGSS